MKPEMKRAYALFDQLADASKAEQTRVIDEIRAEESQVADLLCQLLSDFESDGSDSSVQPIIADGPQTKSRVLGPGDFIGGYELLSLLGQGGQGRVFLARDQELKRTVAIKLLPTWSIGSEASRTRFRREAAVAARLEHPGICSVYGLGEDAGIPFLAMQFIEGETLQSRLRSVSVSKSGTSRSTLSPEHSAPTRKSATPRTAAEHGMVFPTVNEVLEFFEECALALHTAHEAGLVHRDIKPANLMLRPDNSPVILDFGLARDEASNDASLTQTGDVMGTPTHMSPEQLSNSKGLDRRTDVWSLGVTLYEALTLRLPFNEPTREALLRAIRIQPTLPIRESSTRFSKDLEVVLATALEKDRDRRYQTALALAEDLRAVRENRVIKARPVTAWVRAARWTTRRPALATLLLALAISIPTVAGLGGFLFANLDNIEAQEKASLLAEIENLLDEGFDELTEGDKNQAAALFDQAAEKMPTSQEAAAGRILARIALRKFEEAKLILDREEETLDDEAAIAIFRRDVANEKNEDRIEKKPTTPLGSFVVGSRSLLKSEDEVDPKKSQAGFLTAYRSFRDAILGTRGTRRSYYVLMLHALSHLEFEAIPVSERQSAINSVERMWPDNRLAKYWCAIAVKGNKIEAIERFLVAYDPKDPDPLALRGLATAYLENGNLEEAERFWKILADKFPIWTKTQDGFYRRGMMHQEAGRTLEAIDCFERGLKLVKSERLRAKLETAVGPLYFNVGRYEEAEKIFRQSLKRDPNQHLTYRNLGRTRERKGDWAGAVTNYKLALLIKPDYDKAWRSLLTGLLTLKKYDEGMVQAKLAMQNAPEDAQVFAQSAKIFVYGKQVEEGIVFAKKALELGPDDPVVFAQMVRLFHRAGYPEEAEAAHTQMLAANFEDSDCFYASGLYLELTKRIDKATESYRNAVRVNPKNPNALYALARFAQWRSDHEEQDRYLELMGQAAPQNARGFRESGRKCMRISNFEMAEDFYRRGLTIEPKEAISWWSLGLALEKQGRLQDTFDAMSEGAKLGGDSKDQYAIRCANWLLPKNNPLNRIPGLLADLQKIAADKKMNGIAFEREAGRLQSTLLSLHAEHELAQFWKKTLEQSPEKTAQVGYLAAKATIRSAKRLRVISQEDAVVFRNRALGWLKSYWKKKKEIANVNPKAKDYVLKMIDMWQGNYILKNVRPDGFVLQLTLEERQDWTAFWQEISDFEKAARK